MHLADFDHGLWGSNGIVGGGLGVALGAALGARQLHLDRVAVGVFGDGGANTGRVWEFVNLAAAWSLPLIAICENNLYAVETPSRAVTGGGSISARAAGFGLPSEQVDGQDVVSVFEAVRTARKRALAGEGPSFIEALTYRYRGHNSGEVASYRTEDEVRAWSESRDPIAQLKTQLLLRRAVTATDVHAMEMAAETIVAVAVDAAESASPPDPSRAASNVTAWAEETEIWR